MVQTTTLGTTPLPHHAFKQHGETVLYLVHSLGPLSRTQLLHGIAKTVPRSALLHRSPPQGLPLLTAQLPVPCCQPLLSISLTFR